MGFVVYSFNAQITNGLHPIDQGYLFFIQEGAKDMSTLIIVGVLLIGCAIAFAGMFRAWNAPKTEVEDTKQEQENTKQETVHDETREDIVKARLAARAQRRWWRLGRRDPVPPVPALDPKPNRQL